MPMSKPAPSPAKIATALEVAHNLVFQDYVNSNNGNATSSMAPGQS